MEDPGFQKGRGTLIKSYIHNFQDNGFGAEFCIKQGSAPPICQLPYGEIQSFAQGPTPAMRKCVFVSGGGGGAAPI